MSALDADTLLEAFGIGRHEMTGDELRQWCLDRAAAYAHIMTAAEVVEAAEVFYQYVRTGPLTKEPVKQAA